MKLALVCDWLNQFGGAERVMTELHGMFPRAPVFTSVYEPSRLPPSMRGWDIRPSFLQHIPVARRRHQPFFPLMPAAFERMDLSGFEVILSASHSCAKGVIPPAGARHICYCYTPARYLWDLHDEYTGGGMGTWLARPVAARMRRWDRESAQRVDRFIAISGVVADRIRRHYARTAEVIYPPVDVDRFTPSGRPPEDDLLVVSRLVPYKRIDLAIAAANRLGRRLKIVGDGPARPRLERMAGPTIEFLGRLPDAEVAVLYTRASALLFPGNEDFGIAPVEAQAAGRPVIAYGEGGATETVIEGETGVFFEGQTEDSLIAAIERCDALRPDPRRCRENAGRFHRREFCQRLQAAVCQEVAAGDSGVPVKPAAAVRASGWPAR